MPIRFLDLPCFCSLMGMFLSCFCSLLRWLCLLRRPLDLLLLSWRAVSFVLLLALDVGLLGSLTVPFLFFMLSLTTLRVLSVCCTDLGLLGCLAGAFFRDLAVSFLGWLLLFRAPFSSLFGWIVGASSLGSWAAGCRADLWGLRSLIWGSLVRVMILVADAAGFFLVVVACALLLVSGFGVGRRQRLHYELWRVLVFGASGHTTEKMISVLSRTDTEWFLRPEDAVVRAFVLLLTKKIFTFYCKLLGMSSRFTPGPNFDFYPLIDENLHPSKRQRPSGYPDIAANTVSFPNVQYEDYAYADTDTYQIHFKGTTDTIHWPPYFFLVDEENYLRAKITDNEGNLTLSDRLVKLPFPSGGTGEGAGATCANVLNYDAVGDGITDDTQAFKDALSESSCIFVPRGIFKITEPLPLTVSDDGLEARLRITGAGFDSIILVPQQPLVKLSDSDPDNYDIEIDNLRLYGDLDNPELTPVMLDFSSKSNFQPIQVGQFDNDNENQFRRKLDIRGVWFRQNRTGQGSCLKVKDCFELTLRNCFFQHENWDLHGPVTESTTTDEDGNTITVEKPDYLISSPVYLERTNGHVRDNVVFLAVPGAHKMRAIEVNDSVKTIPDPQDPNCDCAAEKLYQGDLIIEGNRFFGYRQRYFPIRSLFKQGDLVKGTDGKFLGQSTGVHVENQDDTTIDKVVARNNLAEVFLKESFADLRAKRLDDQDYDAEPGSMKEAVRFQMFPGYVMDRRDHLAMNDNWFNVGQTYEWPEYNELRTNADAALEYIRFQVDQLVNYVFIDCGGDFTPSIATHRKTFAGAGGSGGAVDNFGSLPYSFQNKTNNQNSTILNYSLDGSNSAYWGVTYNIGLDPAAGGGPVSSGPPVDLSAMKKLHFIAWDPTLSDTQTSWLTVRFPDNNGFEQTLVDVNGTEVPEVQISNSPQEFTLFQKDNVKNNFADAVYDFITFKVLGQTASGNQAVAGDRQLNLAGVWWQPVDSQNVEAVPPTTKDGFHWETGVFIKSWTTFSESIPSEPNIKRPREFDIILNNVAFIYDNALAAYALLGTNDPTDRLRALAIGNAFQKAPFFDQDYSYSVTRDSNTGNIASITYVNDTQNDGRMRNAYQWGPALKPRPYYYLYDGTASTDPANDGKRWVKLAVPFWTVRQGYDDKTNNLIEVGDDSNGQVVNVDAYQVSFWLGNSTWACMLLNSLANLIYTNGTVPEEDNRARLYRDACLKNLEFHEFCKSTTDMGGFHGGFIILFEPGGATVDQFNFFQLPWKSVEHGTDIISYGHQLLNVIGPHDPNWMRIHEGILRHASKFVYRHFVDVYEVDPQGGYGEQRRKTVYYTGGGDPDPANVQDSERKYGLNKNNIPFDVLLWAIQTQYKMFFPQNQAMAYALRYMTTDGSPAALAKYSEPSGEGWIEGTGQLAVTLHCMGQQHLADKKLHACLPYRLGKNGGFWSTTGLASTGFTLPGSTNLWKYYPDEHLGATGWWLMGWLAVNPYQYPNDELEMVGTVPRFTNEPRYTDKMVIGDQDKPAPDLDQGDLWVGQNLTVAGNVDVQGDLGANRHCMDTINGNNNVCWGPAPDVNPWNQTGFGNEAALTFKANPNDLGTILTGGHITESASGTSFFRIYDIPRGTPGTRQNMTLAWYGADDPDRDREHLMLRSNLNNKQHCNMRLSNLKCRVIEQDAATVDPNESYSNKILLRSELSGFGGGLNFVEGQQPVRIQSLQQGYDGGGFAYWNETSIKSEPPVFKVGDLAIWAAGLNVATQGASLTSGFQGLKIGTYIRGEGSNTIAGARQASGAGAAGAVSVWWSSSVSSVLYDNSTLNTNTPDSDENSVSVGGTWQVIGQVSGRIDNQQIGNGFDNDIYLYLIVKISDNTSGDLNFQVGT